jgi:hypothetical protein
MNTSNFTATNNLFLNNSQILYWRFEVVYLFVSTQSSSALNFVINPPPQNGSCSIIPLNGTTSTLFTINCSNWFDENGIQDYSFYGRHFFKAISYCLEIKVEWVKFKLLCRYTQTIDIIGGVEDNPLSFMLNILILQRLRWKLFTIDHRALLGSIN